MKMLELHMPVGPIRVAAYLRKSHEDGLEQEFNSLDAQYEHILRYVSNLPGGQYQLVEKRYEDGGYSGKDTNRPAFQELLRDIKAGLIDCVAVYKLDRLSRSLLDTLQLLRYFADSKVGFISVSEQYDFSRPETMFMVHIMASFAEHERHMTSLRITDKIQASRSKGFYLSQLILGYDRDETTRRLVINEEEAEAVRFIFERFIELKSMAEVAREANARGYRTKYLPRKNGKIRDSREIRDEDVGKWLRNCTYIGKVRDVARQLEYPGLHDPIISQPVWDRVQEILEEELGDRQGRSRQRTPGFLRDIAVCGHCGCHMRPSLSSTKQGGRAFRYYVCFHAIKFGYKHCPLASVPADKLEGYVLDRLHTVLQQPELYADTWRQAQFQLQVEIDQLRQNEAGIISEMDLLRGELKAANEGQAGAGRGMADVSLALSLKEDELRKVRSRQREIKALAISETALVQALGRVEGLWEMLDERERARLVQLIIGKVIVAKDVTEIEFRQNGLSNLARELEQGG